MNLRNYMVKASPGLDFMIPLKVKTTKNIFLLSNLTFKPFVTSLNFVVDKLELE